MSRGAMTWTVTVSITLFEMAREMHEVQYYNSRTQFVYEVLEVVSPSLMPHLTDGQPPSCISPALSVPPFDSSVNTLRSSMAQRSVVPLPREDDGVAVAVAPRVARVARRHGVR